MRLPACLIFVGGCLGLAVCANAQPVVGGTLNCSAATIKGTYGYAVSGFIGSTPAANFGTFTSDGVSSFAGTTTASGGGVIGTANFTATYSVKSNCTGNATFFGSGVTTHLAFTVNANGGVIEFVETDAGATVSGTAQPVAPSCQASDFSGPYTYAVSGWIYVNGLPVPYVDAGLLNATGGGSFTGKSTVSVNGVVVRRTLSGTYTVNAGCDGTVAIHDNLGNAGTLALTLVNNGQEALFLNTTPNTVITGYIYRGQQNCSGASVSGRYVYSVNGFGFTTAGVNVPVAYSGSFSATGSGGLQGSDYISNVNGNGVSLPRTYTASYTVNSDCSGSEVVKDSLGLTANIDFFVAAGGSRIEFVQTDTGLTISGEARPLASGACSNATISGSYGYAAAGWLQPPLAPVLAAEAGAGQFLVNGNGGFSGAETTSFGGTITPSNITGAYQVNPDCTGTSQFTDSLGNVAHFHFVVSPDGQTIFSIETDADTVVASYSLYQVSQPSAGIVNLGSYTNQVAPGGLITIFGSGFINGAAQQATGAPWPLQLGGVTVKVNGSAIPLYYVAPGQIDAQLPVDLAQGAAQMVVQAGSQSTASISFNVSAAAPGVLTYGPLRAVAVDFQTNLLVGPLTGVSAPARAGDTLVVYLVDGGGVNPGSGSWTTGAASPPGLSKVIAPYTVTIGGLPASVSYLGLTTGFVGLYQLNVQVPALPAGDHILAIAEGNVSSPGVLVTVQ